MRFFRTPDSAPQHELRKQRPINALGRTGSWGAFILASMAAAALIFSAASQNVTHGWQLGAATSEFRGLVLAMASAGASVLGPFCWLARFRGRGFGTRCTALVLALGCLAYAATCSLGFVAGARDVDNSGRAIVADQYADRRAVAEAARSELATLKGQTPAILKRRRELAALLVTPNSGTQVRPVQKDAQAAAVAFYITAAGWRVSADTVAPWLNFGMVMFLELAAALGIVVAAGLYPATREKRSEGGRTALTRDPMATREGERVATQQPPAEAAAASKRDGHQDRDDEPPPPSKLRGRAGRPAKVLPDEAVARLRAKGGKLSGSLYGIGKILGTSKSTTHRLLHRLAGAGLVRLETGRRGVAVAVGG